MGSENTASGDAGGYVFHPATVLFPMVNDDALRELMADVKADGLTRPIVRAGDGRILDGRSRLLACLVAQVTPRFDTYHGDPWRYVAASNLRTRTLNNAQKAMVAARFYWREGSEDPQTLLTGTRKDVAALVGITPRAMDRARVVLFKGTPRLHGLVESGVVTVFTASRVAALPAADQDDYVAQVAAGADPVVIAPKEVTKANPVKPSTRGPVKGLTTDVITAKALDNLANFGSAYQVIVSRAGGVDPSLTREETDRYLRIISSLVTNLGKIKKQLKEHTPA